MKIVGSVIAGTLGFILFWTHLAFSSQPLSSYNLLRDVTVDRQGGELLIQLKFKNPPAHFQGPKFFKKSIQVDFPFAYVNPSKRYFDTGDDRVRQVYVSQFDPKKLRLRLMLAPVFRCLKMKPWWSRWGECFVFESDQEHQNRPPPKIRLSIH